MPVGYTPRRSVQVSGFGLFLLPHPNASPRIRFLFVRPALCLGLPPDLQSPATPLPSANTSPCRVCRGLSPPSRCALPGAQKKGPTTSVGPLKNGGAMRDRTADLLHAMQALSQLSYSPVVFRPRHRSVGEKWRPLGDSNPCYRRERAVS